MSTVNSVRNAGSHWLPCVRHVASLFLPVESSARPAVQNSVEEPSASVVPTSRQAASSAPIAEKRLNRTTLTIHGLLEKWAMETPDKIALHDSDSSLTYAQWHRASEHLASRLHTAGVEKGTLVGVQVDRTCGLPVAFTAVSKVGARFLGLNPSWLSEGREMVFTRWNKRFILC